MIVDNETFAAIYHQATPLHKAWLDAKSQNPNSLVFVEYEGCYVTYASDAIAVVDLYEESIVYAELPFTIVRTPHYRVASSFIEASQVSIYLENMIDCGYSPLVIDPCIVS